MVHWIHWTEKQVQHAAIRETKGKYYAPVNAMWSIYTELSMANAALTNSLSYTGKDSCILLDFRSALQIISWPTPKVYSFRIMKIKSLLCKLMSTIESCPLQYRIGNKLAD